MYVGINHSPDGIEAPLQELLLTCCSVKLVKTSLNLKNIINQEKQCSGPLKIFVHTKCGFSTGLNLFEIKIPKFLHAHAANIMFTFLTASAPQRLDDNVFSSTIKFYGSKKTCFKPN
jgi:hypothetical protein